MKRAFAVCSTAMLVVACAGEVEDPSTTQAEVLFELLVEPTQYLPVIPGQLFVVLASATGGEGPVVVTSSVSGEAAVEPGRVELQPGAIAEFTVIARPESVGDTITLDLRAERGSTREARSMTIEVVDWSDDIRQLAAELRDRFVAYLEDEHPELGISRDTAWTPTITKPQILVVMHYLFFSEEWEMGLTWHVTVPEHAWSRMYLRSRDEMLPTFGLEIPSYLDPDAAPVPWTPPDEIDR